MFKLKNNSPRFKSHGIKSFEFCTFIFSLKGLECFGRINKLYIIFLTSFLLHSGFIFAESFNKLSFIVPCYNRAHTIRRAIDSIYKQNLEIEFEVICTDDCSRDGTRQILFEYQNKYSNFKALFHEKNKGASEARNTCLVNSDGDLIFNLDSDNFLEPNTVGSLIDLLDVTGCDIASFKNQRYFTGKPSNWRNNLMYNGNRKICDLYDLVNGCFMPICSGNYLFTRKSYDRAEKYQGRVLETWTFGFRQLATGSRMAILQDKNKNFYWHSVSKDSKWISNQKGKRNDKTMLAELLKYKEIFDKSTVDILEKYNVNKRDLCIDIKRGLLKLIPEDSLKDLSTL